MPASALAEFILWPIFELIMYVVGYLTGYVVVPVFTLGRYRVAPFVSRRPNRYGKGRKRSLLSQVNVISDEAAMYIGLVFWAVVIAAGYFIWRFSKVIGSG
jgi:hypothetical protein